MRRTAANCATRRWLDIARLREDQAEYQRRYDELVSRFEDAKSALTKVVAEIDRRTLVRKTIETFLADLNKQEKVIASFDDETFCSLVDHITVYGSNDIRVTFKNHGMPFLKGLA